MRNWYTAPIESKEEGKDKESILSSCMPDPLYSDGFSQTY